MFRSRKYSTTSSAKNNDIVHTSSLSSGNASIKRPTVVAVQEEYRQSYYTNNQHRHQEEEEEEGYEEYNVDEIIDLQATTQTANELTIESMSAVIAAAVQMSSQGGAKSSLSLGSASILQPFSKSEANTTDGNVKRRFSTRLFPSWKKTSSSNTTCPSTPTTPGLEPSSPFDSTSSINIDDDNSSQEGSPRSSSISDQKPGIIVDDGRDELLYRGIQIKEIKTTLKPLVISDQVRYPMPEVKLERPGFARINY